MGKNRTILFVFASPFLGLVAVLCGSTYSVTDLEEIKYGFTLIWGSHLLNSIAGLIDKWYIDLNSIMVDLVFLVWSSYFSCNHILV